MAYGISRGRLKGSTVLTTFILISSAVSPLAFAQQSIQAQDEQAKEEQKNELQEVVVTGSRLKRTDFNTTSPIQVITKETSTQAGLVSAADILQSSTIAGGSQQINGLFSGFVTDGGPGIKSVSLRGLGANRTLVLLNGRRLAPAGAGGTVGAGVDLNVLPDNIVQRYEILKDGASSVYGSDAVAGVVNAIIRTDLNGLETGATVEMPTEGHGETYSADFAYGQTDDKGSFMLAGQIQDQQAIRIKDRDWAKCGPQFYTDPNTGARVDRIDPATGNFKCYGGGTIYGVVQTPIAIPDRTTRPDLSYALNGYVYIQPDATATGGLIPGYKSLPYASTPSLPVSGSVLRPNGPDYRPYLPQQELDSYIQSPNRTYTFTAFGNRDLDLLGGMEAYGEFLFNRRESDQKFAGQFFPTIGPDNPLNPLLALPDDILADEDAYAVPIAPLLYHDKQEVNYYRAVGGLRGDFKETFLAGWNWDVFYQFGRSDATYKGNRLLADRVANALDITLDGAGKPICADAAARAAGCVALNVFDPKLLINGIFTPEQSAYVWTEEKGKTTYTSHLVNGSINGDLFQLPAGPVAAAAGFELRWDEIDDKPGANSRARNVYGFSTSDATKGSESVREVFGELEVPVLAKLPLIEELTLNGSARYTSYKKTGYDDTTYKAGANWTVSPWLRVRSSYGTSFRAPALYELFLGGQTGFTSAADPCRNYGERDPESNVYKNCAADGLPTDWLGFPSTPEVITYGNNDGRLTAETSNNFSMGVVLTPEFADLNIAVDFFRIKVKGEVGRIGAQSLLNLCYGSADFRTPGGYCDFITPRTTYNPSTDQGGAIEQINDSYFNINNQFTQGFDITVRYSHEFDFGTVTVDNRTTVTTDDYINLFGGETDNFNGTWSDPRWVSEMDLQFKKDDWSFFWRTNFYSMQKNYRFQTGRNTNPKTSLLDLKIEERFYHRFSVQYEQDTWSVTAGVSNIFNEDPDAASWDASRIGSAGFVSQIDAQGRTVFFTLRKSFD